METKKIWSGLRRFAEVLECAPALKFIPPMVMLLFPSSAGQTLAVGRRRVRLCRPGGRVIAVVGLSWARKRAEVGVQSILSVRRDEAVQRWRAYTVLEIPWPESVSPLFAQSLREVRGREEKSG